MCVHFLYEIYLLLYEMPNHFFPNRVFRITFPIFRSSPAVEVGMRVSPSLYYHFPYGFQNHQK